MGISEIMFKGVKFTVTHEFLKGGSVGGVPEHPSDLIIGSIQVGSVHCGDTIPSDIKEALKQAVIQQYI